MKQRLSHISRMMRNRENKRLRDIWSRSVLALGILLCCFLTLSRSNDDETVRNFRSKRNTTYDCKAVYYECEENDICGDRTAGYNCTCISGNCTEVDECSNDNNCPRNAECQDTVSGYDCSCMDGYELFKSPGESLFCYHCEHDFGCDALYAECHVIPGECTCKTGFIGDGYNCVDQNECLDGTHDCGYLSTCVNLRGSYKCTCNEGFSNNHSGCRGSTDFCMAENITSGSLHTFPTTLWGRLAISAESCPPASDLSGKPLASRNCTTDGWSRMKKTTCFKNIEKSLEEIRKEEITIASAEEISQNTALIIATADRITNSMVHTVVNTIKEIADLEIPSTEVATALVGIASDLMSTPDLIKVKSNDLRASIEKQISTLLKSGQEYTEVEDNIAAQLIKIEKQSANNYFSIANLVEDGKPDTSAKLTKYTIQNFKNDYDIPLNTISASISLPASILPDDESTMAVSFMIYRTDALFQTEEMHEQTKLIVGSQIVSATVGDNFAPDFSEEKVITRFYLSDEIIVGEENKTQLKCVFWETAEGQSGRWCDKGCWRTSISDRLITCECNHLTSFAVVMSLSGKVDIRALDVISKIGCTISVISLFVSIACFMWFRSLRAKRPIKIHMSLCSAMLGLYLFFLIGIEATKRPILCAATAVMIHYFVVASMGWMTIEAVNLLFMTLLPMKRNLPYFLPISATFAWGFPIIPIVIAVGFEKEMYAFDREEGKQDPALCSQQLPASENHGYCYMQSGTEFFICLVIPVALLLLFNSVAFVAVIVSLIMNSKRRSKIATVNSKAETVRLLQNAFTIFILIGLTWLFGFLTFEGGKQVFGVLFGICNSMQGFVIFLLFCARTNEFKSLICRNRGQHSVPITENATKLKTFFSKGGTSSTVQTADT